ncbi:MAG: hypothetical protein QMB62_06445 [Oscillospiraceae bacterium]
METGKFESRRRGRTATLLISLLVILGIGVSGTLAYLFVLSDLLINSLNPVQVTSIVHEDFDKNTKNNVRIQNTGDIYAWIRVALVATWEDDDGNAVNRKVLPGDVNVVFSGSGWVTGSDGYYYCTSEIAPNGYTPTLINSVTVNNSGAYHLNYQILCEAIQAEPAETVHEAWPAVIVNSTNQTLTAGG